MLHNRITLPINMQQSTTPNKAVVRRKRARHPRKTPRCGKRVKFAKKAIPAIVLEPKPFTQSSCCSSEVQKAIVPPQEPLVQIKTEAEHLEIPESKQKEDPHAQPPEDPFLYPSDSEDEPVKVETNADRIWIKPHIRQLKKFPGFTDEEMQNTVMTDTSLENVNAFKITPKDLEKTLRLRRAIKTARANPQRWLKTHGDGLYFPICKEDGDIVWLVTSGRNAKRQGEACLKRGAQVVSVCETLGIKPVTLSLLMATGMGSKNAREVLKNML